MFVEALAQVQLSISLVHLKDIADAKIVKRLLNLGGRSVRCTHHKWNVDG